MAGAWYEMHIHFLLLWMMMVGGVLGGAILGRKLIEQFAPDLAKHIACFEAHAGKIGMATGAAGLSQLVWTKGYGATIFDDDLLPGLAAVAVGLVLTSDWLKARNSAAGQETPGFMDFAKPAAPIVGVVCAGAQVLHLFAGWVAVI